MIIDNRNENKKVHEWIAKYTQEGSIDAVTGYFTVGALAYLADRINDRIDRFRFIIGDIVDDEINEERPLDLLNEDITVEGALALSSAAKKAVAFLKQEKVLTKTLEPNFCHAKSWIFKGPEKPSSYFILGSSNLTGAGLGLKPTHNIELNTVGQGTDSDFREIRSWFSRLWERREAQFRKTVAGKPVDFKQYLIDQISRIFVQYTPLDLYYKTLFELFGRPLMDFHEDPAINRNLGRLEHSEIWKCLYAFQRQGVLSLIKMMQTYGGAILADAVGLGKTWSALAVMKYYQSQGYDIVLLCPKRLDHNWRQYLQHHDSRFEKDNLDYIIRYHTDLQGDRLESHQDRLGMAFFQSDRPKLLVIDESHNLRNSRSGRYKFLVEQLLRPNDEVKVLLLSATPINNTLIDVRNQFKLLVKDSHDGFYDTLGINNIDALFRRANQAFFQWARDDDRNLATFILMLPRDFFRLTDALVVARTRRLVAGYTEKLDFPQKEKPQNIFLDGPLGGTYESIEELLGAFPKYFAAYMPAYYLAETEDVSILEDERQRDFFLTRMMQILLVKRLESSWKSFQTTLERVADQHESALAKVKAYQKGAVHGEAIDPLFADLMGEDDAFFHDLTLGKRAIPISEIDAAGNLNRFKNHLHKDIKALNGIRANLALFENRIAAEKGAKAKRQSRDGKLARLMTLIGEKQAAGANRGNKKILVFTAYADTAIYLYEELRRRGWPRIAMVAGNGSRVWDKGRSMNDFEPILQRFVPYTKLFIEKEWPKFESPDPEMPLADQYEAWREWIFDHDPRTPDILHHPIDILIATDCLSEGQNLQDCDFVVNYDIHWNPVRAIQRMGRIDRLGSPNNRVFAANFWPTRELDEYLRLQRRIEDKMAQMRLIGAEVHKDFTENIAEILKDEHIRQSQEAKLLRQMQTTWDDIEMGDDRIGFDSFSLETFRQDLMEELSGNEQRYAQMPNGVYTGFVGDAAHCSKAGIVALLGYPARKPGDRKHRYQAHDLVYIDRDGADVVESPGDVLQLLSSHKDHERMVPKGIDEGNPLEMGIWQAALKNWLRSRVEDETEEGGKVAGSATMDLIARIQQGGLNQKTLAGSKSYEERFKSENVDLILWLLISLE
ncbi:helicase-related protein [uncultured Desulfosarcina sp.]|uniref:helicase-related protein n=1 Tax=uncultured Desulfosarcina sp. TaxID=218289 RepID=UPI0029C7D2C1|nr:SNF2-related protein [uncultured Desulfosarcina sp.]